MHTNNILQSTFLARTSTSTKIDKGLAPIDKLARNSTIFLKSTNHYLKITCSPLQNNKISSAWRRWVGAEVPLGEEIGTKERDSISLVRSLLKKSSTIPKSKVESESPCHTPREQEKYPLEDPLIRTEIMVVANMNDIQEQKIAEKPNFRRTFWMKV